MSKSNDTNLVDALIAADADDLARIRAKIDELCREVKALSLLERALSLKLGEEPTRDGVDEALNGSPETPIESAARAARDRPPVGRDGSAPSSAFPAAREKMLDRRRRQVVDHLRQGGPKHRDRVAAACGLSERGPGCLKHVLGCDLFHVNPDGMVSLTPAGERLAPEK